MYLFHTGKESGCGIYISSVLPSSKAAQSGLKVSKAVSHNSLPPPHTHTHTHTHTHPHTYTLTTYSLLTYPTYPMSSHPLPLISLIPPPSTHSPIHPLPLPPSIIYPSFPQTGDELVRVNGLTLVEATHEEVVNLIKLRKTLTLTLKSKPSFSVGEKHSRHRSDVG